MKAPRNRFRLWAKHRTVNALSHPIIDNFDLNCPQYKHSKKSCSLNKSCWQFASE
jgi:hypothetical protein